MNPAVVKDAGITAIEVLNSVVPGAKDVAGVAQHMLTEIRSLASVPGVPLADSAPLVEAVGGVKLDRTDARTFIGLLGKDSGAKQKVGPLEAIAAIMRNGTATDASKLESAADVRNLFGVASWHKVENASAYLETATSMRLTPQAVRFRSHAAAEGHYAMFVSGAEGVERLAYGRILPSGERFILEPTKGKEFSWQQLNQFSRRVIAAHKLEPIGAASEDLSERIKRFDPDAASRLINPPDDKGGITRINAIESVAAVLRNKIFRTDVNGFENALDVAKDFGDTKIARRMAPDQARLMGKLYLEMTTGAHLDRSVSFTETPLQPGHYALFFDTDSKLPQVAYGRVFEDGSRYAYYPRTNKPLPVDSLKERNLETYRVIPKEASAPVATGDIFKTVTPEELLAAKDAGPFQEGATVDFRGTVSGLMKFRQGKHDAIHQNFMVDSDDGTRLRIIHNVSASSGIAPVQVGTDVWIRGQFHFNRMGQGLLHWTHRGGPANGWADGFVQLGEKKYW